MSRTIHCLAAVAAVALAGTAVAQTGAAGVELKTDTKITMPAIDTNADGKVSKAEAASNEKLAQKFDAYDANKDGSLDKAEFAKFEAEGKGKASTKGKSEPAAPADSATPPPSDKPKQ